MAQSGADAFGAQSSAMQFVEDFQTIYTPKSFCIYKG
jgi:hypothetical protein